MKWNNSLLMMLSIGTMLSMPSLATENVTSVTSADSAATPKTMVVGAGASSEHETKLLPVKVEKKLLPAKMMHKKHLSYKAKEAEMHKKVHVLEHELADLKHAMHEMHHQHEHHRLEHAHHMHEHKHHLANHDWVNHVKVSMKPNPRIESSDGENSVNLNGYVINDWAFFSKDKNVPKHRSGSVMRTARVSLSGNFAKDWFYKFENNFVGANNGSAAAGGTYSYNKINDAYIAYNGFKDLSVKAGHFYDSVNHDNLVKFSNLTFAEPAAIQAFTAPRHLGVAATAFNKYGTLTLGTFSNNAAASNSGEGQSSTSARLTVLPVHDHHNLVHLAVAGSVSRPEKPVKSLSYSYKPATVVSYATLATPVFSNVANNRLLGYEAIFAHKNASLVGEYMTNKVKVAGKPNVKFKGYYVQAGWVLTGEMRAYDAKTGLLGEVTPKHNFNLKHCHYGAWEVAARYNVLDLNNAANNIFGGKVKEYNFVLNWYANSNVKLAAEYTKVKADVYAKPSGNNPNVYMLRAQFSL